MHLYYIQSIKNQRQTPYRCKRFGVGLDIRRILPTSFSQSALYSFIEKSTNSNQVKVVEIKLLNLTLPPRDKCHTNIPLGSLLLV